MAREAEWAFCWDILPKVSRSFAMVIQWLPRNLGNAVMTSYLLCRIADTIEDSKLPAEQKRRRLAGFASALDGGPPEVPVVEGIYRDLMAGAATVLSCYRSLPLEARRAIRCRVQEMCDGMARWCDREIRTLADQNEYCYYVAGIVGKLLTELFRVYGHIDRRVKAMLDPYAVDFGLALQKVNIIRDVRADLEEGRCYWPSELMARHGVSRDTLLQPEQVSRSMRVMNELILDVWKYLGSAVRYLTLLPAAQFRLRVFCAIPLFMAVATAGRCHCNAQVFLGREAVKITSAQVRTIVLRALAFGRFNPFVRGWFHKWRRLILNTPAPWQGSVSLLH